MKLCYIAPAHSIHTQRWVQAFAARGHEVHLIAAPLDLDRVSTIDLEGITVHRLSSGRPKTRLMVWTLQLRRILSELRPTVLHGHYLTRYGWLAAATLYRPLVLTAWGSDAYVEPAKSRLAAHVTRWSLRRADIVTADAADLERCLLGLGARTGRTHIVQWGVDTNNFRPDIDTRFLRAQLALPAGTPEDAPLLLCTRSLNPVYNQDIIVEALSAIRQAVPGAILVLKYGSADQTYSERLQQLVAQRGLSDAVRLIGPSSYDELPAFYVAADIFISMAASDSTPVSLLEAMASGTVPVVSDLPALREWVTDGFNGFCVPARDSAMLAAAVVRLLTDPDLRRRFADTNRQIVLTRADHLAQMDEMESVYAGLAARARRDSERDE